MMRTTIKLMTAVLLLVAILLCMPVSAKAETKDYLSYEEAVEQLREAMINREETPTLQVWQETDETITASVYYDAVAHDGVANHGDYIKYHLTHVDGDSEKETVDGGYVHTLRYNFSYRTTLEQEMAVDQKVQEILDELDVYDATDYQKVAMVYNYLCSNVNVSMMGVEVGDTMIYTTYGALVREAAVCQGFASAFYRLALELGVDNRIISGAFNGTPHGWNVVALDDVYYLADATKDAGFPFKDYRYFLIAETSDYQRDSEFNTNAFRAEYPMATAAYSQKSCLLDEGAVIKLPSGYEEGIKTFKCRICGKTKVESIPRNGWMEESGKRYYYNKGILYTGWQVVDDVLYHFDETGAMSVGKTFVDNTWYLFDENGQKLTGWQEYEGQRYFIDDEGIMQTGWQKLGDYKFYFNADGVMQTGWKKIGDYKFYFNSAGVMQTGWKKLDGYKFYFNSAGVMQTGWQKLDGYKFYFNSSGVMQTGWKKIGDYKFYFNSAGVMQTGWKKIGGYKFYFNSAGVMQTGWKKLDGYKFYFNSSGVMQTGWKKLGGYRFYFNSAGIMQTGWKKIGGNRYCFNSGGIMQTGWAKIGGNRYYFNSAGVMQTGRVKIGNRTYRFSSSGILIG